MALTCTWYVPGAIEDDIAPGGASWDAAVAYSDLAGAQGGTVAACCGIGANCPPKP